MHMQTNESGFELLQSLINDLKRDNVWKTWDENWKFDKVSEEWQVVIKFEE